MIRGFRRESNYHPPSIEQHYYIQHKKILTEWNHLYKSTDKIYQEMLLIADRIRGMLSDPIIADYAQSHPNEVANKICEKVHEAVMKKATDLDQLLQIHKERANQAALLSQIHEKQCS